MSKQMTCHPKIWAVLCDLRIKRQNSNQELGNMILSRDATNDWFKQNSYPGDSAPESADASARALHGERLKIWTIKSVGYAQALIAIAACRTRLKWLEAKYDSLIDLGISGRLTEGAVDEAIAKISEEEPPAPLYSIHDDEGLEDQVSGPVGVKPSDMKVEKPAAGSPSPVASSPHAETKVYLVVNDERSVNALHDIGLITLGDVARWRTENVGNCRLTKLGVTGKDELKLEAVLREAGLPLGDPTVVIDTVPVEKPARKPITSHTPLTEKKKPGRKAAQPA